MFWEMKWSPSDRMSSGLQGPCALLLPVPGAAGWAHRAALSSSFPPEPCLPALDKCTVLYHRHTKSGFNPTDFWGLEKRKHQHLLSVSPALSSHKHLPPASSLLPQCCNQMDNAIKNRLKEFSWNSVPFQPKFQGLFHVPVVSDGMKWPIWAQSCSKGWDYVASKSILCFKNSNICSCAIFSSTVWFKNPSYKSTAQSNCIKHVTFP